MWKAGYAWKQLMRAISCQSLVLRGVKPSHFLPARGFALGGCLVLVLIDHWHVGSAGNGLYASFASSVSQAIGALIRVLGAPYTIHIIRNPQRTHKPSPSSPVSDKAGASHGACRWHRT